MCRHFMNYWRLKFISTAENEKHARIHTRFISLITITRASKIASQSDFDTSGNTMSSLFQTISMSHCYWLRVAETALTSFRRPTRQPWTGAQSFRSCDEEVRCENKSRYLSLF